MKLQNISVPEYGELKLLVKCLNGIDLDQKKVIEKPAENLISPAYRRIIGILKVTIPEISKDCVSGVKQAII